MPSKKPSPDQNANKATSPGSKPASKKTLTPKPTKATPAPVKAASKWRTVSPAQPVEPIPEIPRELNARELRFAEEYLIDLNATRAYLRAVPGSKEATGSTEGSRLLANLKVAAYIAELKAERSLSTGITAERALAHAWSIATADARELIEFIVGCCRHCYGEGFKEQRSLAEFNTAREKHLSSGSTESFDEKGGIGLDPRRDPHPDCPECFGKGSGRAHINDTRKLSAGAVALYAGVKITKDGLEVKMHSKLDALEKVFKHLGLYEKDNNQKVDPIATLLATIGKSAFPVVKTVPLDD